MRTRGATGAFVQGPAGSSTKPSVTKESAMSIIRVAVQEHLKKNRQTIRELLEAAYYHRFEKPVPQVTLDEDVRKWEAGQNDNPYLYDFMLNRG